MCVIVPCSHSPQVTYHTQMCTTSCPCDFFSSMQPPIPVTGTAAPARGLIDARTTCIGPRRAPFSYKGWCSMEACATTCDASHPPKTCCKSLGVIWVIFPQFQLPGLSTLVQGLML